ncbi:hypothetical protein Hanom_Chr00s000001g01597991 [Helianthus anomalus]
MQFKKIENIRAFTSNPSNYTYILLKHNSYINIFPLKTNIFFLFSFQLNNIIIIFFSLIHPHPLSIYIKKNYSGEQCPLKHTDGQ